MVVRKGGNMTLKDFCDWAFYGKKTDALKPEEIYTCYLIWCELFKVTPMKKFEFIEMWRRYEDRAN